MIDSPDKLLDDLKVRGIALIVRDEQLFARDPLLMLTPEIKARIAEHKTTLIKRLALPLGVMADRKPQPSIGAPDDAIDPALATLGETPEARAEAEARMIALLEQWDSAPDRDAPRWARWYAVAAIRAGAPCFETVTLEDETIAQVNAGPHGWRRWLMSARGRAG